jgi:UDP-glucose 6-dehydrogenase
MREACAIPIINQLLKDVQTLLFMTPVAMQNAKMLFKDKIRYASTALECLNNADAQFSLLNGLNSID